MLSPHWLVEGGISYEIGRSEQKDLSLVTHFCRLAAARDHVAAQYSLAVVMANGKSTKCDLEKALALILIAKQQTRLNPNARLLLNTVQISRAECEVATICETRI